MTTSRVCILLADGLEEIEAITLIDVLRRAELDVTTLGVTSLEVTGAHGVRIGADALLSEAGDTPWDLVVLPGGMPGAEHLRDSEAVRALIHDQVEAGRPVAAICAAPIALAAAGVLEGRAATCYPGFDKQLGGARYTEQSVVVDGPVITSRGPGTALAFALHLVSELCGEQTASQLADGMLVSPA
jgi:4-methyl-5(b-hydroxyethyl)-thiazole monophosphate biosynthesis